MNGPRRLPTSMVMDMLLDARLEASSITVAGIDRLLGQLPPRAQMPLQEVRRVVAELDALEARQRRRANPSGRLRRWTYASGPAPSDRRPVAGADGPA